MTSLLGSLRRKRVLVIAGAAVLAVGLGTSAAIWGPELFASGQPAKATNTASSTGKAGASAKELPARLQQVP